MASSPRRTRTGDVVIELALLAAAAALLWVYASGQWRATLAFVYAWLW